MEMGQQSKKAELTSQLQKQLPASEMVLTRVTFKTLSLEQKGNWQCYSGLYPAGIDGCTESRCDAAINQHSPVVYVNQLRAGVEIKRLAPIQSGLLFIWPQFCMSGTFYRLTSNMASRRRPCFIRVFYNSVKG